MLLGGITDNARIPEVVPFRSADGFRQHGLVLTPGDNIHRSDGWLENMFAGGEILDV